LFPLLNIFQCLAGSTEATELNETDTMTFTDFVNQCRIIQARTLQLPDIGSISAASDASGFQQHEADRIVQDRGECEPVIASNRK
jgi:hypothetical protein